MFNRVELYLSIVLLGIKQDFVERLEGIVE